MFGRGLPGRGCVLAGGLYERASGAAGQPLGSYRRRAPERTVLHELVARHAETLIAELREADQEREVFPQALLRLGPVRVALVRILSRIQLGLSDRREPGDARDTHTLAWHLRDQRLVAEQADAQPPRERQRPLPGVGDQRQDVIPPAITTGTGLGPCN